MGHLAEQGDIGQSLIQSFTIRVNEGKIVQKLTTEDREFDVFINTKVKLALKKGMPSPISFDYQDIRRNHFEIILSPVFKEEMITDVLVIKKRSGQGSIEALLRENRTLSFFKKAIDKHAILMVINKQGKIIEVNEHFLEVSGYKEEEILLKPVKLLNSGYHSKEFWKNLWRRVLKGETFQEEIRNVGKLGNYFWLDTTIVPVFDEYERFQYFVSIAHNITDIRNEFRKKLERQFQLASLGKIAAKISHEINNPLTVINGIATKMKLKSDNPVIEDYGSTIIDNIKRIESISDSIRSASRRGQDIVLGEVNLGDVFNHLISIFSIRCKQEGVSLNFVSKGCQIFGNYDYIIQILINLINNSFDSVRYNDEPLIQVFLEEEEDYVHVKVRDNGPLVNDLIHREIFQEFFTTKSSENGTGIGLSISKDMAQKMGGDLFLEQIGGRKDFIIKLSKPWKGEVCE
jgi:PAS domain S-box-containing protein